MNEKTLKIVGNICFFYVVIAGTVSKVLLAPIIGPIHYAAKGVKHCCDCMKERKTLINDLVSKTQENIFDSNECN